MPEECNKAIKLYEDQDKFNKTMNRLRSEKVNSSTETGSTTLCRDR